VQKVSIISRGFAGGYTMKLPAEDQHLKTRSRNSLADLAMMMGGYASEKLTFGDVSTGASNDLKEASEPRAAHGNQVRHERSRPGRLRQERGQMMFLGREISSEKDYSEKVAGEIDGQVHNFIAHAYATAEKILKSHKAALKKIADTLIQKETLEQDEFYGLLKPYKIKPIAG
jgi:cell division protease FtsH